MKLIDMHHEPGHEPNLPAAMPGCDYPYGLRLNLQQEQLEALGIELPPAGTEFRIEAIACVTRSSTEDPDADGDIDHVCIEMQITELGMEEEGEETEEVTRQSAGERLYGKKKE